MKYFSVILSTLILNLISIRLIAQDSHEKKYSFQFDLGISRNLHYSQPVSIDLYYEPYFPQEQKARFAPNINLSLYRAIDDRNSLKLGIGFSAYRFKEKGISSDGGPTFSPYETIQQLGYFNISSGFRHIFNTTNKLRPFIETDVMFEIHPYEDYIHKKNGIAMMQQVGVVLKLSAKSSLIVDGFYKTGIVAYNKIKIDKDYIPFGYGIQVGMNFTL